MMPLFVSIAIAALIAFFGVRAIDYMNENHSDYKGDDFLNDEK